jgi:multidrug efflux pump subunit AcrA (membrane-fusion protein)
MKLTKRLLSIILPVIFLVSCKSDSAGHTETADSAVEEGSTPVTLTEPQTGDMSDSIELNAVSCYRLKTFVKSSANGYLQLVNAEIGRYVTRGQELFVIRTKESQSLGNTITKLDTSLHFDGSIHIKSPGTGFITQVNYRSGDYVQDGEQLLTITDTKSFVFILSLPYELRPYLASNKNVQLALPDKTILSGYIEMAMPTVDSVSQTQNFVIRVNTEKQIPENLIAKVKIVKQSRPHTVSLLKSAVLTDETQSQFWIMKMIDSATAVKVPVTKGMESAGKVEILLPRLLPTDKIVLTGNYGLGDTAKVTVIK